MNNLRQRGQVIYSRSTGSELHKQVWLQAHIPFTIPPCFASMEFPHLVVIYIKENFVYVIIFISLWHLYECSHFNDKKKNEP